MTGLVDSVGILMQERGNELSEEMSSRGLALERMHSHAGAWE